MIVRWFGQSAYLLRTDEVSVFIDPFGSVEALKSRVRWEYPAIEGVSADLLLITHEHLDHNAAEVVGGSPRVIRSTAGRFESPVGEVVAVASEHDEQAGTARGPNSIFVFGLDGKRVCHFGDFGQARLREEQAAAIGDVDLLFVPVGGGPVLEADRARAVVDRLQPRWVVPMHFRTPAIDFLEPADAFLERFDERQVRRLDLPEFETASLEEAAEGPVVVLLRGPGA